MFKSFALIAVGASLGACARYGVTLLFGTAPAFWATLAVNLSGSFLLGWSTPWLREQVPVRLAEPLSFFIATGFLSSFTTFSTFSRDVYVLGTSHWVKAGALVVFQVGLGLACFVMGLRLGQASV